MPLPFFSRSKDPNGAIDIKVRPVADNRAAPAAIASRVAPDLGDYAIEYPEPLPAWGRVIPLATKFAIAGLVLSLTYFHYLQRGLLSRNGDIQAALNQATSEQASRQAEMDLCARKTADLAVLSRWVALDEPVRDVIVAALNAATDRAQVRSLELRRRDPGTARYSLVMVCSCSRSSFEALKVDLATRLESAGWAATAATENPTDPDDGRLIIDLNLARKN